MGNQVVFNFFDEQKTFSALCEHFCLPNTELSEFLVRHYKSWKQENLYEQICIDFIKIFSFPLAKIDTSNVLITAKHITTFDDKGRSLKKWGLINLRNALEKDTPLKRFFKQNNIVFDFPNEKLYSESDEIRLFLCNSDCIQCLFRKPGCKELSEEYKQAVNNIYIRIFCHKAELEVFLCGKESELEKYGTRIVEHPEIVWRLDNLLNALHHPLKLNEKWAKKQKEHYYILEFDTNINDFAERRFLGCLNQPESYYDLEEFFLLSGYTISHFIDNKITNFFYHNLFFIWNSLGVLFDGSGQKYGEISSDKFIPYETLRITKKEVKPL
jgi:hypothetical protein